MEHSKQQNRQRLPNDRKSIVHKFHVGPSKGYMTVGLYDDGRPGELFLRVDKAGSPEHALLDSTAIMISMALQYGVPLKVITDKLRGIAFSPSGATRNPEIPWARSVLDYVARWLELKFVTKEADSETTLVQTEQTRTGAPTTE